MIGCSPMHAYVSQMAVERNPSSQVQVELETGGYVEAFMVSERSDLLESGQYWPDAKCVGLVKRVLRFSEPSPNRISHGKFSTEQK